MLQNPLRLLPLALLAVALTACPSKPPIATDETPPEVSELSPADGATDVAIATTFTATFSEAVKADTVKLEVLRDEAAVEGTLTVDGKTATFAPAAALAEGIEYRFVVQAGYEDLAGNAGKEAAATFTTLAGVLQVAQTTPADGAQNVALDTPISARFNRPLAADTLNEQSFHLRDGTNAVSGTVSYQAGENTAVFAPANALFEGRAYTATLTTAITDVDGGHLPAARVWTFTTAATVPTVVSVTPVDGSQGVAGNAPVRVVFSEGMDPASFTAATFQVTVQGQGEVPGTRTWSAPTRTATFQPTGAYPGGAIIDVLLTPGVKDASGIGLGAEVTASFTVSDAPSVTASTPAPNDVDVGLGTSVELTFSAVMDVTTLTSANVWIEDSEANAVAGTYVPSATTLLIAPAAPLTESEPYTVVVTTDVRSAVGVNFAAEYRFTFTTLGVPPSVVSVSPAPDATDVPVAAPVRLVFNEDMDEATFTDQHVKLSDGAAEIAGTLTTIDARTVELQPAAPLLETATYTVIATSGLTDVRGNALQSEFRSTFRTEPLPRIVSMLPAPNSQNVASGAALILVANKALKASTVTLTPPTGTPVNTVTLYEEDQVIEGAIAYEAATRSIRVTRQVNGAAAPWTAGKRYLLVVDGTKLEDLSGNTVGGRITNTFVAGAAADSSAPVVTTMSPLNGETGVSRQAWPFAQFNEPIDPTTLSSANVHLKNGAADVAGRIEYVAQDNRVVFIPDARLPASTSLTFTVAAGIADTSGNVRAGTNAVSFTTQGNAPPQLVATAPANNAANVNVNTAIRLVFSEPVESTTVDVEVTAAGAPVPGTLSYDEASSSAVYRPAASLPSGATITVVLKAGLEDKEGMATDSDVTRTFDTVANGASDITPPSVTASLPAQGAQGISARPTLQLSFSEPLDPATVAVGAFSLQELGGNKVPFGLAFDAQSETVTVSPSAALKPGTNYQLKVDAGVKDLAGNAVDAMAASSTLSFTVDGAAPTITARSPAASSTVGTGAGVEITFSEAMNARTLDAASFTLTTAGAPVLSAVWYEAGTRTLFLRPAAKLVAGAHTVALDGARAADLAGNTIADTFGFTVSTSGPSVDAISPCGSVIDPAQFGSTVVSVQFDVGVKKAGGGNLDAAALQLRIGANPVATQISHTAGAANATLTPTAALQQDTTYTVHVENTQVQNDATSAAMTSPYSCTFRTKKIIFGDTMDPMPQAGWTSPATGQNQWKIANTMEDPGNTTQVWRGGHNSGAGNYTRLCDLFGGTAQEVRLERVLNLAGLTEAELRLETFHQLAANDSARVQVVVGTAATNLEAPFSGATQTAYAARTYNLTPYVNQTVTLRFALNIAGGNSLGGCPATNLGFFVDNIQVVGQ